MRGNSNSQKSARMDREAGSLRIRSDLEVRGVAPEFSQLVAKRLAAISSDLSDPEYAAVLNGVAAAYRVHADACEAPVERPLGVNELQRLTEGFATELHKLEEGLQILSAYVVRLGDCASRESAAGLH